MASFDVVDLDKVLDDFEDDLEEPPGPRGMGCWDQVKSRPESSPCSSGISSLQSEDSLKLSHAKHHFVTVPSAAAVNLPATAPLNARNGASPASTPVLTPVSELTARLKGPFALTIGDEDCEAGSGDGDRFDDDKENAGEALASGPAAASMPIKCDAVLEAKKPKLDVIVDADLTPTSTETQRAPPYVSEAELDALLEDFDRDSEDKSSLAAIVPDVDDLSFSASRVDATESEIDALLDSGHSSVGEMSSLVGSIDDLPSSLIEIPSSATESGGEEVATSVTSSIASTTLTTTTATSPSSSEHNCPSGARPKVRPGSLQVMTMNLPVVPCVSGGGGGDNAAASFRDAASRPGAGAPEDLTPTNFALSTSLAGDDDDRAALSTAFVASNVDVVSSSFSKRTSPSHTSPASFSSSYPKVGVDDVSSPIVADVDARALRPTNTSPSAASPVSSPDSSSDLDQSSSSIRHVTSPPTPFQGGPIAASPFTPTPSTPSLGFNPFENSVSSAAQSQQQPPLQQTQPQQQPQSRLSPESLLDGEDFDEADAATDSTVDLIAVGNDSASLATDDDVEMFDANSNLNESMNVQLEGAGAMPTDAEIDIDGASDAPSSPSDADLDSGAVADDSVKRQETRPSAKRPSSLDLPTRSPFAFKPQKRHHKGADSASPSLDSVDGVLDGATAATPDGLSSATTSPDPALASAVAVALASIPPEYRELGSEAPKWVPDSDTPSCVHCGGKFTFTKRRHHCRSCGKIFCGDCWGRKAKLRYMGNKEGRVCTECHPILNRIHELLVQHNALGDARVRKSSSLDDLDSVRVAVAGTPFDVPPPPPAGVLRKEGSKKGEPKQVIFSDGIRPGGDLTTDSSVTSMPPSMRIKAKQRVEFALSSTGSPVPINLDIEDSQDPVKLMSIVMDESKPPVIYAINRNLFVSVKIVRLTCCVNKTVWTFTSDGMCTVGQDEIVIVLECLQDQSNGKDDNLSSTSETSVPRDIFCHFNTVYEVAAKGNYVSDLGHTIFNQSFLGSRDHGGFLYVRPTFQCLQNIPLPKEPSFIFGILLQKWETPWAKVFPLRLMLRLGAHEKYYPCPIVGERFRKPLFAEIGHTIMNLLADFRNYQYTLPQIKGVVVHMEDKKTVVRFPSNRYQDVMRVVNACNEHVMAFASNFSEVEADSHLVCVQNDDGGYQTQAINIQNRPRKVTGASFVVFNGALKTSSGLKAKSSIVEDGLMVQVPAEVLAKLKQNLKDMRDFEIECGSLDPSGSSPEEVVVVEWGPEDRRENLGVFSAIDGKSLEGVPSIRVQNGPEVKVDGLALRWTEVFLVQVGPAPEADDTQPHPPRASFNFLDDQPDINRLSEMMARATSAALSPHLAELRETGKAKVGLRVTLGTEMVGYEIGANGAKLGDLYMNDLDNELVPVIHKIGPGGGATSPALGVAGGPLVLELVFFVVD